MMFLTHNNNDTGDSILAKVRRDPISGNRFSQLLVLFTGPLVCPTYPHYKAKSRRNQNVILTWKLNIGLGCIARYKLFVNISSRDFPTSLLAAWTWPGPGDSVISKIIIKTVSAVTRDPPPPLPLPLFLTVATV